MYVATPCIYMLYIYYVCLLSVYTQINPFSISLDSERPIVLRNRGNSSAFLIVKVWDLSLNKLKVTLQTKHSIKTNKLNIIHILS